MVPVTGQRTDPGTRPILTANNKGHDKHFAVSVFGQSALISGVLVPGPTLCLSAVAVTKLI